MFGANPWKILDWMENQLAHRVTSHLVTGNQIDIINRNSLNDQQCVELKKYLNFFTIVIMFESQTSQVSSSQ